MARAASKQAEAEVKSVENPEPEVSETQKPEEFLANHENPTVVQMWGLIESATQPLYEMQETVRKSSPPPVSELDAKLKVSEDPQAIEYRQEIEKLEKALREAREDAHNYLLKEYQVLSSDDLKALKADYAKQYEQAKTAWTMLDNYANFMANTDVDVTGVKEALAKFRLPSLRGIGGNTGNANTEGTPRTRVSSVVVTKDDGTEKTFEKINAAALWAKQTAGEVIKAWLARAEVSSWQEIDQELSFEVNGVTYTITPRDTPEE